MLQQLKDMSVLMQQMKDMSGTIQGLATVVNDISVRSRTTEAQLAELRAAQNPESGEHSLRNEQANSNSVHTLTPGADNRTEGSEVLVEPTGSSQLHELSHIGVETGSRHQWSIKEIKGLLPEYDPLQKTISSEQFVAKANMLQRAYKWSEEMLLIAVQHQLKGAAKHWVDAQQVFETWKDFVLAFMRDFPTSTNSADHHRELMRQRRKPHQPLLDFYYATLAIGRRGNIDEKAIVSYVIEGINDPPLAKSLLAQNITTCVQLVAALENVSTLQPIVHKTNSDDNSVRQKNNSESQYQPDKRVPKSEGPKCFNCNERGHIASRCPQPQRKARCTICQKVGHDAKSCYAKPKPTVSSVQPIGSLSAQMPPIMKTIYINNEQREGFVDTGSGQSFIEKAKIPEGITCQPTNILSRGFGGGCVESQEAFTALVKMDDDEFHATFYVIPEGVSPHPVMLGRNILCRHNRDMVICVDHICVKPCADHEVVSVMATQQIDGHTFNINDELPAEQRQTLITVLEKYKTTFAEDLSSLGRSKSSTMKIEVTKNDPVVGKRYQIPFAQRGILSAILQNLRDHDIIRASSSPHAASVVLVRKANGEHRMCVDFRAMNAVTIKKHYPMPVVEEQLSRLAGSEWFTTLDMTSGYYQIPMDEGSKQYTAFATHEGLFEHNVMPFGLVNAPMQFQEMIISNVISKLNHKNNVISYVDEVIIATPTAQEGIQILEEVLEAIRSEGLTLRPSKCRFLQTNVKFLGHRVSKAGIQPSGEKIECIKNFPTPTNMHEVRQFLGLTGFFRKFMKSYALKTGPLTGLLKKNIPFVWGESQAESFEFLKNSLIAEPILALYDANKPHEVHTDASNVGLSGILMQLEDGNAKAVFYYSRQCNEAERRYASHELEVLAIVESLERFRLYLLGSEFKVITDCNAVVTTKATTPLPARISRWLLRLQEFNFVCVHRPGSQMAHVDGMSRAPTLPPQEPITIADCILPVTTSEPEDWIFAMQMQDSAIQEIVENLQKDPTAVPSQLKHDYVLHKNRLYRLVNGERRLVIPRAIRWRITRASHDEAGHFGLEKTIERISKDFWFPRIRRYVNSYINACPECCLNKAKGGKAEGELHISEAQPIPFRTIHMDHLGPFQKSKRGNQYIIALVCAFTRYTILKAVRTTKSTPVIQMLKDVMSHFGQPTQIITDRGTAFTSREFEAYVDKFGIKHIKTAVRTPRANGQVERVNRTILASLKCSTVNPREWDALLPTIQWAINSQKNATTKFAPNDLIFNFKLKNVSENRIVQAVHEEQPFTREQYDVLKIEAAERINKEKQKWKMRFDQKHKLPRKYNIGDLVVVDYVPTATTQSHKLDPLFKGPYVVTKVLDADRYVVEDLPDAPRTRKRYVGVRATDHMKPWCQLSPDLDDEEDSNDSAQEDE